MVVGVIRYKASDNFFMAKRTQKAEIVTQQCKFKKNRKKAGWLSTKILYLLFDGAFILVDSHPALYFLLEFRLCWEKMFWYEGKFSDLKSLISALAVA